MSADAYVTVLAIDEDFLRSNFDKAKKVIKKISDADLLELYFEYFENYYNQGDKEIVKGFRENLISTLDELRSILDEGKSTDMYNLYSLRYNSTLIVIATSDEKDAGLYDRYRALRDMGALKAARIEYLFTIN